MSFTYDINYDIYQTEIKHLKKVFPHSYPRLQIDLSKNECNIYRTFRLEDLVDNIRHSLTDSEYEKICSTENFYVTEFAFTSNYDNSSCLWILISESSVDGKHTKLILSHFHYSNLGSKVNSLIQNMIYLKCSEILQRSKRNRDDKYISDYCEKRNIEFFEDGVIFDWETLRDVYMRKNKNEKD